MYINLIHFAAKEKLGGKESYFEWKQMKIFGVHFYTIIELNTATSNDCDKLTTYIPPSSLLCCDCGHCRSAHIRLNTLPGLSLIHDMFI